MNMFSEFSNKQTKQMRWRRSEVTTRLSSTLLRRSQTSHEQRTDARVTDGATVTESGLLWVFSVYLVVLVPGRIQEAK